MTDREGSNGKGREKNAAQDLGDRKGLVTKSGTRKTGRASTTKAGPDGGDASIVGRTFKER